MTRKIILSPGAAGLSATLLAIDEFAGAELIYNQPDIPDNLPANIPLRSHKVGTPTAKLRHLQPVQITRTQSREAERRLRRLAKAKAKVKDRAKP